MRGEAAPMTLPHGRSHTVGGQQVGGGARGGGAGRRGLCLLGLTRQGAHTAHGRQVHRDP